MDAEVEDVNAAEAAALVAAGALIVDVREVAETAAGRIPGAILMPLSELPQRWREVPDADRTVFVCRSGARSESAAHAFAAAGRPGCANLLGGVTAWSAAGQPFDGVVA